MTLYYSNILYRSLSATSGLPSNGHVPPAKTRAKYMTAPRAGASSINESEQKTQNESVQYLDLQLPKNQAVHTSQVDEVSYAIIQR